MRSSRSLIRVSPKEERTADGVVFASKAEMLRYRELRLLERAGEIRNLELQPRYPLVANNHPVLIRSDGYPKGRQAVYRPDFRYEEKVVWAQGVHWVSVIEDVK